MIGSYAIRAAVYSALKNDATLSGQVQGVWEEVPDSISMQADPVSGALPKPIITLGAMTETPWHTLGTYGAEATLTLHVWSRYVGSKESLLILGKVFEILEQNLTVPGFNTVVCTQEMVEVLTDTWEGEPVRHGVARYRITVQKL